MVTFTAVAIVVSVLVSRRSIASRAELIGRERMMLLRSVSHDLRNPLNSILGASTELLRRRRLRRRDPQASCSASSSTRRERLDRIVDNLLSLSRVAGRRARSRSVSRWRSTEIVEQCERGSTLIGASRRPLEIDEPLPDVDVDVDPVQIDQVLTNLVENAVRHASRTCVSRSVRR